VFHIWMSHTSCCKCEWAVRPLTLRHASKKSTGTHFNKSCSTHSHESCSAHGWVMECTSKGGTWVMECTSINRAYGWVIRHVARADELCVPSRYDTHRSNAKQCTSLRMAQVKTWYEHAIVMHYYHMLVSICTCNTGWRRPIGFLNLQVILCKRATYYMALFKSKHDMNM